MRNEVKMKVRCVYSAGFFPSGHSGRMGDYVVTQSWMYGEIKERRKRSSRYMHFFFFFLVKVMNTGDKRQEYSS